MKGNAFSPQKVGVQLREHPPLASSMQNDDVPIPNGDQEGYKINGYSTSGYHDMLEERGTLFQKLFGKHLPPKPDTEADDGWGEMRVKDESLWKRVAKFPFRAATKVLSRQPKPGTLILIRHGQSEW